jgi:hypothetical protein
MHTTCSAISSSLIWSPEQYLVGKNHEDPHYAIFPSPLLLSPSRATVSRFRPRWKNVLASPGRADWLKIFIHWIRLAVSQQQSDLGLVWMDSFVQLTNTDTTEKYKHINNTDGSRAPFWTIRHWEFVPASRLVSTSFSSCQHSLFLRIKYPTQHSGLKYPQPVFIRNCERPSFTPKQALIWLIYLNL